MSDRKKTFVIGMTVQADTLTEAWHVAVESAPTDFTPDSAADALEAGILNFSIVEAAQVVAVDFGQPEVDA